MGSLLKLSATPSFLPLGIALLGGMLMGLTPAPVEAWFLAWIALAPLWMLVVSRATEKHPYRHTLLYALAWGVGYHGAALFWITGIHPMMWMGVPWLASIAIALFAWTFITLWGAAIVILWALGMTRLQQLPLQPWQRVLIGTTLWCALEGLWSFGNLYWTSLSYTQSPHNLIILHLGRLSGPLSVTAAIVCVNGFLAEAALLRLKENNFQASKRLFTIALSFLLGLHLLGGAIYRLSYADVEENALRVGIIQGNIPNAIKLYSEGWRKAINGYTEGYRNLARQGVDAILTPETALPFVWNREVSSHAPLQQQFLNAVVEENVPVWVGGYSQEGKRLTNSLFTITGTGEIINRYDKVKLVPLGEYIPFEEVLGQFIDRLSPLDAHLVAGSMNQLFDTPVGRAIVGICYDSAFSEPFRRQAHQGGEFILSASNDAHYSEEMPRQHHAQDVMRAVETDRWAVRATNTGYSAIVDYKGRTQWISQMDQYELHAGTIYRRQTQTLYVQWGNWLIPVLLGVSGVNLFLVYISSKQREKNSC